VAKTSVSAPKTEESRNWAGGEVGTCQIIWGIKTHRGKLHQRPTEGGTRDISAGRERNYNTQAVFERKDRHPRKKKPGKWEEG